MHGVTLIAFYHNATEGTTIKPLFTTGASLNTRLLVTVILSVSLLITDRQSNLLDNVRNVISIVLYPIERLVNLPPQLNQTLSDSLLSYQDVVTENTRLKEQQFIAQTKLLKLAALEKENIRLQALLGNSFTLGEQLLTAELLAVNLAPYEHTIALNKGSRFGIHKNQPVISVNGVVGQVTRSTAMRSEVLLISDPSHAIPVQINRNGLYSIAVGSGQINQLNLPYLPNNSDIRPGDLLITSGLGGTFPQGYPVATVTAVTRQPDKPFAIITATPKAQLDRLRELLIVWSDTTPIPLLNTPEPSSTQNNEPD